GAALQARELASLGNGHDRGGVLQPLEAAIQRANGRVRVERGSYPVGAKVRARTAGGDGGVDLLLEGAEHRPATLQVDKALHELQHLAASLVVEAGPEVGGEELAAKLAQVGHEPERATAVPGGVKAEPLQLALGK